ncbi:MAG TPA: TadE/TadG family type IV pilus assembly protein [Chloroflexia bacterium]
MFRLRNTKSQAPREKWNRLGARARRGQATVELALTMPLLALLLAVVIDGGLAINSWMRITTAARDGTRFAMDSGRPVDVKDLIMSKLPGLDAGEVDIYLISGKTNPGGNIPCTSCSNWNVVYHYGPGPATGHTVQPLQIRERLRVAGDEQADDELPFTLVEVDYVYEPFLGKLLGNLTIPMSSYAIVEQYGQD